MKRKVSGFPQMKKKNQEHPQWSETSTLNPDVDPIVVRSNVGGEYEIASMMLKNFQSK